MTDKRNKIRTLLRVGKYVYWVLLIALGVFWLIIFPLNLLNNQVAIIATNQELLNIKKWELNTLVEKVKVNCNAYANNALMTVEKQSKEKLDENKKKTYAINVFNNCVVTEGMGFLAIKPQQNNVQGQAVQATVQKPEVKKTETETEEKK